MIICCVTGKCPNYLVGCDQCERNQDIEHNKKLLNDFYSEQKQDEKK